MQPVLEPQPAKVPDPERQIPKGANVPDWMQPVMSLFIPQASPDLTSGNLLLRKMIVSRKLQLISILVRFLRKDAKLVKRGHRFTTDDLHKAGVFACTHCLLAC